MTSLHAALTVPTRLSSLWGRLAGALLGAALCLLSFAYAPASVATGAAMAAGMTLGVAFGMTWSVRHRDRAPVDRDGTIPYPIEAVTQLGEVLRHCENAIVLTDPSLRIWYANDAFVKLSGCTMCTAAGTTIVDVLAHRIANGEMFTRSVEELALHVEQEACGELTHLGTPARAFEWRSLPLRRNDGSVWGRGFLFHDRSQARELAGLKSDFLSTVTHELRTPLTSVKGSLQLVLGKSTALSPIDCELLNISLKNADRLIRLINDLLDISRLELGKIELTFARVPTASLVEEAAAGLRSYAGGREITIGCEIDPAVPALKGDRDRLIQVLTNLISNAVKFSPARGHVLVRAQRQGDAVAITVQDWGIGIPAADHSRLFQRFQRLNPGQSDEPGTGLGLAISKAIMDRHGGQITLTSGENAGSTFTITVPALMETRGPAVGFSDPDISGGSPPTVLLVDDDQELGAMLQRAWNERYQLIHVGRGVQALDTARQTHPDLVLLDVVLPDLSGYDVLRILRTTAATSAIPVIMLTIQPERALATNLGAVDVVGKPLDLDHLTRAVEHALQERHANIEPRVAVAP
ncbi:MAG: two-component hybrid sensor and regulator [Deltaproteobacteria bacterium]|nr:two-component hybrid sensor and regulator [Deltaproteobacteria bacterium]